MSSDLSHIGLQSLLDRRRVSQITNEEELEGENTGDKSFKRPANEKLNQEFESTAAAEIHSQERKKETTPPQVVGSGHQALGIQRNIYLRQKNDVERGKDDNRTRGHELYLKYILLLLQAAHLALKGFLCKKVTESALDLAESIIERKDTFKNRNREVFQLLFKDDGVNTNYETWDTRLLCVVILILFYSESDSHTAEFEAVDCILEQRKDLDNYVQSASLNFNTFETKWKSLHDAVIELIKDIDPNAIFECKRIIHSYEPAFISITSEVIRNLIKTNDVNMHVQIALQNIVDLEQGKQDLCDKDQLEKHRNVSIKFTEKLQDKFLYVDDSAVLTCKLNVSEEDVSWRHNNKHIKESETMKKLTDGCCHWLAISRAKLEDAGLYTCTCCNASTIAYLRVSEKPLKVTEELHVATEETNVRENMDIVLVCKVSRHTSSVTWRHNGEVINASRHCISVDDNVHTLTLLKAQYEDEGEYTIDFVATQCRTEVIFKGNFLALRAQLANTLYKNWIKGALGLKFLKLGLEGVSRSTVQKHHAELLAQLSSIGMVCTQCTTDKLLPAHPQKQCANRTKCICSKRPINRTPCPNGGFCSKFFDLVLLDHRFNDLLLTNTDIQKWATDPWSVAKCYISTSGYHDKSSEKEIDCAGLLSLFINNTFFERNLNQIEVNGETDVFKKAKDTRNDILHNASYELSEGQLNNYLDLFTRVLEVKDVNDKQALQCYRGTKEAIANLNLIRKNEIDICLSEDFNKQKQELKDHAMTEIAEKIEEATKQNNRKVQHLEERLSENEKELQLLRDVKSSQTELKNKADSRARIAAVFKLDWTLQVIEPTGAPSIQGNLRIFQCMKYYNSGQNIEIDQYTSPTDASVQHLLEYIKVLENCKVADISNANDAVVVIICCSTCEAIETFLKLVNGNEFQRELIELRKCLQLHDHMKIDDVIVSCSSESLEKTRKRIRAKQTQMQFTCEKHILECIWYCSDHEKFVCPTCKDVDHGRCDGLKQVISGRSYREQKQRLILKSEIGKFDVKIKRDSLSYLPFRTRCNITSMCMLPNGEILLVDCFERRLTKLNRTYNIVSHCDISNKVYPRDVCYIGNDRAAVCVEKHYIQFVNVSGNMRCEQRVELDNSCYMLACQGETLYVGDTNKIYRYNKECQQTQVLFEYDDYVHMYPHMAVSDDGEIFYIANEKGLITIDKDGNHMSTLYTKETRNLTDVCVVGDGTVLVARESGDVYQVDYKGENVLVTGISSASVLKGHQIMCFDRLRCRLLVVDKSNSITVFELMHNTC